VGGDDDVSRQWVAGAGHVAEFESAGDGGDGAIGVGHEADGLGAGADAPEAANDPQGGRGSTGLPAGCAGDEDAEKVGGPPFALDRDALDLEPTVVKHGGDGLTRDGRCVQQFVGLDGLL
jgi:hypothetical protein